MGMRGKHHGSTISAMLELRPIPACWVDMHGEIMAKNTHMDKFLRQHIITSPKNFLNLLEDADAMLLHSYLQKSADTESDLPLRFVIEHVNLASFDKQVTCELQHISNEKNCIDWLLWLEPLETMSILSPYQQRSKFDVQTKSAIMDASLDTLVTIDLNDIIVEYSKAGEETFGWTKQEVLGKRMVDVLVPAPYREAHMKGMQRYQLTQEGPLLGKRIEIEALHKDGFAIPIELALVPLKVNNENYVTAFMRDIRKRKIAEQELLEQKHKAEQASMAKSRFLSHMSHELRSPLNSLLGTLDVLGQSELNNLNRYYLQIAISSGDLLLSVINDVLDFSKIESGNVELIASQVNLKKLIGHALTVAQARCSESVLLSGYIHPDLADEVVADEAKIRQIVVILVDNALKFTKKGAVTVTLKASHIADSETDMLHLRVSDTGVGIEKEMQQAIFAEFEQVDAMRDTRYGGTGLGLAIARKLVELMGGEMSLSSEVGIGTTFNVYFPMLEKTSKPVKAKLKEPLILFSRNQYFESLLRQCLELEFSLPNLIEIKTEDELLKLLEQLTTEHNVVTDSITDILLINRLVKHPQAKSLVVATRLPITNEGTFNANCTFLSAPLMLNDLLDSLNGEKADPAINLMKPSVNSDHHLNLLLVEDQKANRVVARALLEKYGYVITDAEDGIQALEQLDTDNQYDVILMDMRMPRLNGIETAKQIRRRADHYASIPIIALTANAEQSEIQRCYDAGFDAFVTKPFNVKELTLIIKKFTQGNRNKSLINQESN